MTGGLLLAEALASEGQVKKSAKHFTGWRAAASALVLLGCGGATSIDGRWDSDGEPGQPPQPVDAPAVEQLCPAAQRAGHGSAHIYAEPPAFWLGSQAATPLRVDGPGFFAVRAGQAPHGMSFATELELFVGPDGTLENELGGTVLGYPAGELAPVPCVGPLRAPLFAPPVATTQVWLALNLDARATETRFDIENSSATAFISLTFLAFDSRGGTHYVDVYFVRNGVDFEYHVLVDGADLVGGVPGVYQEVSVGSLSFDPTGLPSSLDSPPVCVQFAGGGLPQCMNLAFDVTGYAAESAVQFLSVDGFPPGTGAFVSVDPYGAVMVGFDNGSALDIGRLALARFAREAALHTDGDGQLHPTPRSGRPQLGYPLSPGRGTVQSALELGGAPALEGSGLGL